MIRQMKSTDEDFFDERRNLNRTSNSETFNPELTPFLNTHFPKKLKTTTTKFFPNLSLGLYKKKIKKPTDTPRSSPEISFDYDDPDDFKTYLESVGPYVNSSDDSSDESSDQTTSKPLDSTSKPLVSTSKPLDSTSKPLDSTSKPWSTELSKTQKPKRISRLAPSSRMPSKYAHNNTFLMSSASTIDDDNENSNYSNPQSDTETFRIIKSKPKRIIKKKPKRNKVVPSSRMPSKYDDLDTFLMSSSSTDDDDLDTFLMSSSSTDNENSNYSNPQSDQKLLELNKKKTKTGSIPSNMANTEKFLKRIEQLTYNFSDHINERDKKRSLAINKSSPSPSPEVTIKIPVKNFSNRKIYSDPYPIVENPLKKINSI